MSRTSGSSYLGFPCINCRLPIVALTIPRDTATPDPREGIMRLQCANCGFQHPYRVQEMRRFEVEQLAG
jgi:hypothetical protein